MDSRSEPRRSGPCTVGIRCFLALCTLGSALAQTTMSELREPGEMQSAPQASLTQAGDRCASLPGGPEGYVCGALGVDKITPSVVAQPSQSSGRGPGKSTQQFLHERLTVWVRGLNWEQVRD